MSNISCKHCGEPWIPLFRIIESYPGREIDVHGMCGICVQNEDQCNGCEYAPTQTENRLNITVFVQGDNGKIVFEDKENGYTKYFRDIRCCPMCGRPLRKNDIDAWQSIIAMAKTLYSHLQCAVTIDELNRHAGIESDNSAAICEVLEPHEQLLRQIISWEGIEGAK